MKVSVVLALPARQQVVELYPASELTARAAVMAAVEKGLNFENSGVQPKDALLGIFGERVDDDQLLQDGDRVEIYRPLHQDPMELRRQRAALEPGRFSKRRK